MAYKSCAPPPLALPLLPHIRTVNRNIAPEYSVILLSINRGVNLITVHQAQQLQRIYSVSSYLSVCLSFRFSLLQYFLSLFLSVSLSLYLSVCLSLFLYVSLSVCLSVYLQYLAVCLYLSVCLYFSCLCFLSVSECFSVCL